MNKHNLSEKPNTTTSIEGTNPEWNDIIFIENLEDDVSKDSKALGV